MKSSICKLLSIFVLGFLISACDEAAVPDGAGMLHELTLDRLDGTPESLVKFSGKIVVLNLWATWCSPCKIEMPDLEVLKNTVDPEKIAVIGLSIDKNPEKAQAYLSNARITFAEYIDPGQKSTRKLFKVEGLPTTLIFNRAGHISHQVVGIRDWKSAKVIGLLEDLYAGKNLGDTAFD